MKRLNVLAAILAIVTALIFSRLGFWQLHRLHERRARNAALASRLMTPAVPLARLASDSAGAHWRRVEARGRFDFDHQIVLSGRTHNGSPGVQIVTPLHPEDGGPAELDPLADERDLLGVVELEPVAPVAAGVVSVAGRGRASTTTVRRPARAARNAVAQPTTPAPTMTRSAVAGRTSVVRRRNGSAGSAASGRIIAPCPPVRAPIPRAPAIRGRVGRRLGASPRRAPRRGRRCAVLAAPRAFDPSGPVHRRRERARRLSGARGAGPEALPRRRRKASWTPAGPARRTVSGRCAAHGVGELRFAGGPGQTGTDSGLTLAASRSRAGRRLSREWVTEFYETGARAGKNVTSVETATTRRGRYRAPDRRPQRRVVPVGRSSGSGTAGSRSPSSRTSSARSRRRSPRQVVREAVDACSRGRAAAAGSQRADTSRRASPTIADERPSRASLGRCSTTTRPRPPPARRAAAHLPVVKVAGGAPASCAGSAPLAARS